MGCLCEDRTCLWQRWREKDTEDRTTVENKKRKRKQTAVRGQRERARLDDCAEWNSCRGLRNSIRGTRTGQEQAAILSDDSPVPVATRVIPLSSLLFVSASDLSLCHSLDIADSSRPSEARRPASLPKPLPTSLPHCDNLIARSEALQYIPASAVPPLSLCRPSILATPLPSVLPYSVLPYSVLPRREPRIPNPRSTPSQWNRCPLRSTTANPLGVRL